MNHKTCYLLSCLLLIAGMLAGTATAATEADGEIRAGTLMLHGQGVARSLPAVRLGTDMDVTVTGPVARVRVTQAFRNTSADWMAAHYLYPLPPDGAVDSLKMVVGQRVIVGRIEKREKARAIYEQAAAEGRKAGLVAQQRPNVFSNRVANVGPGETVLVAIEYQMPVRRVRGTWSLRLPLVVGPRYVPPHTLTSPAAVADAARVTAAPVLDPALGETVNPVSITVHLEPGFVPADIESPYHAVEVTGSGASRTVRLAQGEVPADRDFELNWRSAEDEPGVGLFRQRLGGHDYLMASLTPPAPEPDAPTPPREMVFVIDNSGSMGGASLREAKASLLHALDTLGPEDRFNIIRFDDSLTRLFTNSVAATPEQLAIARRYTRRLEAGGGTEMLPALRAALDDAAAAGGETRVRQVIFLTDGAISNEAEMLATLGREGGRSRVFPVGIGSAPNTYLMARMARIGRGTFTHIGTADEVNAEMTRLLETLRHPAVRNLRITASDPSLELTPDNLPDLYAGEPLVVLGRADELRGTLTVRGERAGQTWTATVNLANARPSPAVARLWGRRRIADVRADRILGRITPAAADERIAALGLEYSLVTDRTSLVAVDETPSRPDGARLTREDLPINLPAGWDFDALFGTGPAPARPDTRMAGAARTAEALNLPQTATDYVATLRRGLGLLGVGVLGLLLLHRRRPRREVA